MSDSSHYRKLGPARPLTAEQERMAQFWARIIAKALEAEAREQEAA